MHDPDAATHSARAPAVLRQVLDETLPTLQQLKKEGLVRAIGLGTNDVAVVLQVLREADLDVLMLAGRYSLLDHSALPELLPQCVVRGVRVALGGSAQAGSSTSACAHTMTISLTIDVHFHCWDLSHCETRGDYTWLNPALAPALQAMTDQWPLAAHLAAVQIAVGGGS